MSPEVMANFMISLKIMAEGMGGVFLVSGLIALCVSLMRNLK